MKKRTLSIAIGATLAVGASALLLPGANATEDRKVDGATKAAFGRIADDVLTQRTAALVDGRQERGYNAPQEKKVRLSGGMERTEGRGVSSLYTRKQRLASLGEAYSNADTKVTTDRTTVKGDRATVEVTETTVLTYKKIRGDEPGTTGFTAHHTLTFTRGKGGKWELSDIKAQDDGPGAVNQPQTAPAAPAKDTGGFPKATPASISWPARQTAPKSQKAGGYDYKAMAAYAEKYWRNYNPEYRSYNDAGGDCTNFISQALRAGGWKDAQGSASDSTKWWYNSKAESTSFVGANEWSWYAMSSNRVTNLKNVYQMDVGDILQMDFDRDGSKDHSMIVTYKSRIGIPYMTYHSTNTFRKSLASIIASYPDAVYYAYRT
ncbi:amidase domain-containing protein [Streptomyces sp. UNOB3_S3]|uniref:amidase domain-containing protein n=1 Tax=Streptomyces sp. UNOB3_S3 TaxID=2871682 RepID=UPI001E2B0B87|nr:amidase domain-containing protein [Streptomyces sp. UNOB3_S3]